MINLYDIAYGLGLGTTWPFWFIKGSTRRKVFKAFAERMGKVPARNAAGPAVMIHAVSLGEINATRTLIDRLRKERAGLRMIVSVTTDTGFARGLEIYGSATDVILVRYPLDFSGAINRFLDALKPSLVVLMELEMWPNFIRQCGRRGIPVLLINGRVTTSSFGKYKLAKPLIGGMFRALTKLCAQDSTYEKRFIALGAKAERVSVTGTMKFDTAAVLDRVAGQDELANAVYLKPGEERIWVCGSTGPGEEEIVLRLYRRMLERFAGLRLVIVPRKPERFDDVARLITDLKFEIVRRSNPKDPGGNAVVLGDTIGDLRKFYAMADVIFVGRTLVDLGARQHGSDMIEPAALGRPVIVGTFTGNFAEAMEKFREADAMIVVKDSKSLGEAVEMLLSNSEKAKAMGQRAREVVIREQGATDRHVKVILQELDAAACK